MTPLTYLVVPFQANHRYPTRGKSLPFTETGVFLLVFVQRFPPPRLLFCGCEKSERELSGAQNFTRNEQHNSRTCWIIILNKLREKKLNSVSLIIGLKGHLDLLEISCKQRMIFLHDVPSYWVLFVCLFFLPGKFMIFI